MYTGEAECIMIEICNGHLVLFTVSRAGVFVSVAEDGYSFLYQCDQNGKQRRLLKKVKGSINALVADENKIYFCLNSKCSRFYFRAYQLSLETGEYELLDRDKGESINEYIVCARSDRIYYTTNKLDARNNSIICKKKDGSSKVLQTGKDGLLLFMDTSPDYQSYCYANVYSNVHSDILVRYSLIGEIKINGIDTKSVNYDGRYLDSNRIIYITNENQERQYLCQFDLVIKKKTILYQNEQGEVDLFCVDKEKNCCYIKVVCGVRDQLYYYDMAENTSKLMDLPENIAIISGMTVFEKMLYLSAESEKKRASLYRLEEWGWNELVPFGNYENGYCGTSVSIETKLNQTMEMMIYRTWKENKGTVLWIHGGPNAANRCQYNHLFTYFLESGFHILAPNYVGSNGYGRECLEYLSKNMDNGCNLIIQQCKDAIAWGKENGIVKSHKLLVCGESFGGYISLCMVLQEIPDMILCINLFGPMSLYDTSSKFPEYMKSISLNSLNMQEEEKDACLMERVQSRKQIYTLIVSGEDDTVNSRTDIRDNDNLKYVCLEQCGHGCTNEKSYYKVVATLENCLQKVMNEE